MKGLNLWFKNYYAPTPFMWFSLTFLFHSRNCYEYHGMNLRLYANFLWVNNMKKADVAINVTNEGIFHRWNENHKNFVSHV